jgi:integrase
MSPTLSDGVGQRDVKLDTKEAEELLEHLGQFEYATFSHTLILLLWGTGLRMGSVRALNLNDFNPEDEHVSVCHRPGSDTPVKNEQNGERLVALDPSTCAVLSDYIEVNRPEVTDDFGREPLLATENGRPSKNTVRATVYRWTRPCMYRGSCPHSQKQDDCKALNARMAASKCPSSVSPHAVRRGSITHHHTQDVPE